MPATTSIYRNYGATPSEVDVSTLGPPNIRFKTDDTITIDNNNPIPIVAATTKRSFWIHIYLKASTAPAVKIDNVRFYTSDGTTWGTGTALKVGTETPAKTSVSTAGYDEATGSVGDTGDVMTDHTGITASTDAFALTEGSPKTVPITEGSSQIDAANETSNYVVLQMEVIDTATQGDLGNETMFIKYDEI